MVARIYLKEGRASKIFASTLKNRDKNNERFLSKPSKSHYQFENYC